MAFVQLGKKWEKTECASPSLVKSEIHYPNIYIEKDLGLDEEDVGKEIEAKVKLKVKSVEKRISENKKTETCSLDILAIDFNKTDYFKKFNK